MTALEQKLFDRFKRLDSTCCDMFSCQHGVSEYIAEMEQTPYSKRSTVPSWERDYRTLKHLRWLRNQIAHNPSPPPCTAEDIEQLENFYNRILSQQDPLALAAKAESRRRYSPPRHTPSAAQTPSRRPSVFQVLLTLILIALCGVLSIAALIFFTITFLI